MTRNFEVTFTDDKRFSDSAPLGYMSIHYTCKLPAGYVGPRYEKTKSLTFEIQVRTLCMHCWAAVSHYIDYKGEWDVPKDLKMALSALSGLFYVADSEFQQFYSARAASKENAVLRAQRHDVESEINLDTLSAYLRTKFPDRTHPTAEEISKLVQEIKDSGYTKIEEVDREIRRAEAAFQKYELQYPPSNSGKFSNVGVARISLALASKVFREHRQKRFGYADQKISSVIELVKK